MRNHFRVMRVRVGAAGLLAVAVFARPAAAENFKVDCARLDPTEVEELDARIQLTLRSATPPPEGLHLGCGRESAWLIWDGPPAEQLPIDETHGLLEGVIDAVEARVATDDEWSPEPTRPQRVARTRPDESEDWTEYDALSLELHSRSPEADRAPRRKKKAAPSRIGGLGLALTMEPIDEPDAVALGPRLDIALRLRRGFSVVAVESLRRSVDASPGVTLFDAQLGVAWGAPYSLDHWVGFSALGGVGLLTTTEFVGDAAATVSGGVRSGFDVETVVLWTGVDVLYRTSPLTGGSAVGTAAQRTAFLFSVGGFLTAPAN